MNEMWRIGGLVTGTTALCAFALVVYWHSGARLVAIDDSSAVPQSASLSTGVSSPTAGQVLIAGTVAGAWTTPPSAWTTPPSAGHCTEVGGSVIIDRGTSCAGGWVSR